MYIKGCNSLVNLRKTMIYNTNIDLVNDDVYTKFVLIPSICSQDIEYKTISDMNQLCCKFAKNNDLQYQCNLVNDNVYTKFGLNRSNLSQDIEQKLNHYGQTDRQTERE